MSSDWYKFMYRFWEYAQNFIPSVTIGSIQYNIVSTSVSVTASCGDWVDMNATTGAKGVTLPDPSLLPGALVGVCKVDASANAVTVIGTIDGAVNFDLIAQYETLTLVSVGSEWRAT